jgi:hypothetical protein
VDRGVIEQRRRVRQRGGDGAGARGDGHAMRRPPMRNAARVGECGGECEARESGEREEDGSQCQPTRIGRTQPTSGVDGCRPRRRWWVPRRYKRNMVCGAR